MDIAAKVKELLSQHSILMRCKLTVEVVDNGLIIEGQVGTYYQKQVASHVAMQNSDIEVKNKIKVEQ